MNKYTSSNLSDTTSTHLSPPAGTAAATAADTPVASAAEQLVLLAAAAGLSPAGGWQAAGVTQQQLRELKRAAAGRLSELRQLAVLGELYPAPLLTHLLKSRLAQRLLATDNAAELERLAKIIERLPGDCCCEGRPAGSPVAQASLLASSAAGKLEAGPTKKGTSASRRVTSGGQGRLPSSNPDPDADVDNMELAEALAEAKRLIDQLEEAPHG